MPLRISHSIKLLERHFNLIPFVLWGYFYWVKIAAVRKISVNHGVMLTLRAKVRWEGQAEKWRQEGKRARRGAKCQRKLSFFLNELDFFSLCPGSHVMLCLGRGQRSTSCCPLLGSWSSVSTEEPCYPFSSSREIESSSRSAQLQSIEPGPCKSKRSALSPFMVCKGSLSDTLPLQNQWILNKSKSKDLGSGSRSATFPPRMWISHLSLSFCKWETWNIWSWRFCWIWSVFKFIFIDSCC